MSDPKSSLLHRNLQNPPPRAVGSFNATFRGVRPLGPPYDVNDALDISSGAGVTGLGHSNHSIKNAMIRQIEEMPYAHAEQWTTYAAERAAQSILGRCGPTFEGGGVTFFSGGSEAVEAACKLAMQINATRGHPTIFMARDYSYHGATMFSLCLGTHPRNDVMKNQGVLSRQHVMHFMEYAPHLFLVPLDEAEILSHEQLALKSLENLCEFARSKNFAPVVIIETIGGTCIGIAPPTDTYLRGVRAIVDAFDGVIIYDEILSGNFRTGTLTAAEHYAQHGPHELTMPDIIVMGKGITAGYFPMSAVVLSDRTRRRLEADPSGRLGHTSTNQNHPIGCAAVVAAMSEYEKHWQHIARVSKLLAQEVVPALRALPVVKSVQGVGTLWGINLAHNIDGWHKDVKLYLRSKGITCYSDGGTIKGKGNMIMLAPPFVITQDELTRFVEAFASIPAK